ncbi:hypothetical protein Sjap_017158 [Stephania japonica]|uniref:Cyanobacterial aminoacyl-tRNA synthetase CAAD domain-containing protein n=1 Tax=Stephania japonica TaxID=461633 RepID=A0AAP0I5Q4_9MAGN
MELCISRALSNVPRHSSFAAATPLRSHSRTSLPLNRPQIGSRARLYSHSHLVRAAASDEASTSINSESEVADTGVVVVEESPAEKQSFFYNKVEESAADRPSLSYEVKESAAEKEIPKEEPLSGEKSELFELLEQYNIKLDSVDTSTVAIYGSTSLFALWIASAVVGAIDAIPLVPKVLELVGLGYSVWFSYRYLIFKENRGELLAKIDELKKEIIGED